MANYILTVGPKAQVFHDQATGITICKGEEVELRPNQFRSRRIQQALASGHLQLVPEKNQVTKYSEDDITKLNNKIKAQYAKGVTIAKIASSINLEQAKLIATRNEVSVDENDTVEDILSAVLED